MTTVFGHPPEASVPGSAPWTSTIHPEDRDAALCSLQHAIGRDDVGWTHDYRMLRCDGTFAHVPDRNHIVRDDQGTAVRIVGAISDMSRPWVAEQALRLGEARYRQLAEHSAEGALEAMVGYPRDTVYADPNLITSAIPAADRARMQTELERTGAVSAPLVVELGHRDGQVRHVRIRGVPLRDTTGRVSRVRAVVTDVTRERVNDSPCDRHSTNSVN